MQGNAQQPPLKRNNRAPLFDRFSSYEPNYFLSNFGSNDFGQVKFKISFKYDLGFWHNTPDSARHNRIFFAYTQFAFWDLYSLSAPMRDINFSPMLHWEHQFRNRRRYGVKFESFKIGYLHQSNGQVTGAFNRSIFKVYTHVKAIYKNSHDGMHNFKIARAEMNIHLWAWNILADQNKDIADYQGYGQIVTTASFDWAHIGKDGIFPMELSNVLIPAPNHISTVLNFKVNPWINTHPWVPYFYFQYWYGYGESLLNYDNRYLANAPQNILRAGIQFRVK